MKREMSKILSLLLALSVLAGMACITAPEAYAANEQMTTEVKLTSTVLPAAAVGTYVSANISDLTLQPGTDETRMNFCWYSDSSTSACCVQLAEKSDMTAVEFPVSADSFVSFSGTVTASPGTTPSTKNSNKATVTGLKPATEYVYRVGDGTSFSETYSFETKDLSDGYEAILVGDPQIGASGSVKNDTAGWDATVSDCLSRFENANLILSAGDQVNTNSSEDQYENFFSPSELTSVLLAPTIGNHDNSSLYKYHYNSSNESTSLGTTDAGGDYWFTYGNTLYMVLNTNSVNILSHETFIKNAVDKNADNSDIVWKVVMFHQSICSSASHSNSPDILLLRNYLYTVFDKYDIDVVLMGHDHCYTRSYQMLGGEAQTTQTYDDEGRVVNPTGTLYITANSGSGSKYYDLQEFDSTYRAVRWQGKLPSYSHIEVTDKTFSISTYVTGTGELIDTYAIYKGSDPSIIKEEVASLTADGNLLTTETSDCVALELAVKDDAGAVDLTNAKIVYKYDPEGVISVDSDGVVTLKNVPAVDTEVEIWAEATLDGRTVASNTVTIYIAVGTAEIAVRQAGDDMEEYISSGELDYNSSDLEFGVENPDNLIKKPQLVGIRFSGLSIPAGAKITDAYIQFTVDEPDKSTNPFSVKIYAEDSNNSKTFENVNSSISDRLKTSEYVGWTDDYTPKWTVEHESNSNERTPDLTELVQQIVDKPRWSAGNAISFIMEGISGNRTAEAYNGESTMAPVLHVTYVCTPPSTPHNFTAAFIEEDPKPGVINLSWDCVDNADGYILYQSSTDGVTETALSAATTTCRIACEYGKKYYFSIAAKNEFGRSGLAYANIEIDGSGTGGSTGTGTGGGTGTGSVTPEGNIESITSGDTTTVGVIIGGTATDGRTCGSVDSDTANSLVEKAEQTESSGNNAVIKITLDTDDDADGAEVAFPYGAFAKLAEKTDADLTINVGLAEVTFDPQAVESLSKKASSGDIVVKVSYADISDLTASDKNKIGGRPALDFALTAGGTPVSQFEGKAYVSIPYTLLSGENPNAVVVYYLDDECGLQTICGKYSAASGNVEFSTSNLSKYAIGYNMVAFDDVLTNSWYYDAVSFVAARGVTLGTGADKFSPNAVLTRGQFIVMLMRAYGIQADENPTDNFTDAGSIYYTDYLSAAKRLGIANGVGNNMFAPDSEISREDMFTLLYRALVVLDKLPDEDNGKTISDFYDGGSVADYAKDAMDTLIKGAIVSGSSGKLDPMGSSTRAQMAQVLYNLLSV